MINQLCRVQSKWNMSYIISKGLALDLMYVFTMATKFHPFFLTDLDYLTVSAELLLLELHNLPRQYT